MNQLQERHAHDIEALGEPRIPLERVVTARASSTTEFEYQPKSRRPHWALWVGFVIAVCIGMSMVIAYPPAISFVAK